MPRSSRPSASGTATSTLRRGGARSSAVPATSGSTSARTAATVRPPSRPGGSTPRRHSACWQVSRSAPASRSREQPVADRPPLERVQLDGEAVGRLDALRTGSRRRGAGAGTRGLAAAAAPPSSASSMSISRPDQGARADRNGAGGDPRAGGGECTSQRRGVEAERAGHAERARRDVAPVERLQRVSDQHLLAAPAAGRRVSRRVVERVEQLAERHRRRTDRPGPLVGAGVGDHQMLGRGEHRVEHELSVLAARVALAHRRDRGPARRRRRPGRRAGTSRRRARAGRSPGAAPTASAPSCRPSACPVRKFARVGRPPSRPANSARRSASPSAVVPARSAAASATARARGAARRTARAPSRRRWSGSARRRTARRASPRRTARR